MLIRGSGRTTPEPGVVVRHERTDSHHLRMKLPDKEKIISKIFQGLAGSADHESGANLKSGLSQVIETLNPVF